MVKGIYKNRVLLLAIVFGIMLVGCRKTRTETQPEQTETESDDFVEDDISFSVISESYHELAKKDIKIEATKWGSLPDEYEYCIDAVDAKNIYLEECHDDENGNMLTSYGKIDLETRELTTLYTPIGWNIIFDPIMVDGNLVIEVIKNSSTLNNLDYEIVSVSEDGNVSKIYSDKSYYYPRISKTGKGFSILTFSDIKGGIEESLSYYDLSKNIATDVLKRSYLVHGEESIGDEIYRSCGGESEILYNVSTYDHEIRQEGSNGSHLLYRYSLEDNTSSLLEFQPGYLCDYFMTDGKVYLTEKTDTTDDLNQSGDIYLYNGSSYEKWIVPPVTPINNIKQAEFIRDDVICVQLTSGILLIDLKDMTYWYKESYCSAYTKDKIWYSDGENIYYINIENIM